MNWTALAAVVTAFLALVTGWMAWETRKSAVASLKASQNGEKALLQVNRELALLDSQTRAVQEQASLTRASIMMNAIPILVPVAISERLNATTEAPLPFGTTYKLRDKFGSEREWDPSWRGSQIVKGGNDDSSVWVLIEMRNIGSGSAVVDSNVVSVEDDALGGQLGCSLLSDVLSTPISHKLNPQQKVIPPSESTFFVARLYKEGQSLWERLMNGWGTSAGTLIDTKFIYQGLLIEEKYQTLVDFRVVRENGELSSMPPTFLGFGLPAPALTGEEVSK